ncbi:MAG: hypothetical protein ACTSYF_00440 [Promethearchaeota archaeon]
MIGILLLLYKSAIGLDDYKLISILLGIVLFIIILVYIAISSGKEEEK